VALIAEMISTENTPGPVAAVAGVPVVLPLPDNFMIPETALPSTVIVTVGFTLSVLTP
jgi:hypothetical protein